MRHVGLLTISLLFISMFNMPMFSAEQGAPISGQTLGDWVIQSGDDLLYEDETIVVNGDLIIQDSGILRLNNMRIEMRGRGDNEAAAILIVEEGGSLFATQSTITAYRNGTGGPNDFTEYKFEVYGSMVLENCHVSRMWGLYDGYVIGPIESTHSEVQGGIQIFSDDVQIFNSTVTESQSSGIYIVDASPLIMNCSVSYNNRNGLWAGSRYNEQPELVQPHIHNNTFESNEHNAMWFYYAEATVLDNTVIGGNGGIALSQGAEGTRLERAKIDGAMWRGLWFWVDSHTAADCTVANIQLSDIELINTATPIVINTSFNRSKVTFQMDTSLLTVKNYLTVMVEDQNQNPILGADVEVKNCTDVVVLTGSTDQHGILGPELLEVYRQNRTLWWNSTPFTIHVSKEGYQDSEVVDLHPSKLVTLELDTGEDDFTSPEISDLTPGDGTVIDDPQPLIRASYQDTSGIELNSVTLELDGILVTDAVISASMVSYTPSEMLADGTHMVKVEVSDSSQNHNTAQTSWDFTIDTSGLDRDPPVISGLTPEPDSVADTLTPLISADYFDESGIDLDSVVLILDGVDVTSSASVGEGGVEYTPNDLDSEEHTVRLRVVDRSPLMNTAEEIWSFTLNPRLFDISPPEIYDMEPGNGTVVFIPAPTIKAKYRDAYGIDVESVQLFLDENEVTFESQVTESDIEFTPPFDLEHGDHSVELRVRDGSSNSNLAVHVWYFTVDLTIDDHKPPEITGYEELDGRSIEDRRPEITLTYSDDSGVDVDSIVLILDGEDVTHDAIFDESSLTFIPGEDLEPGQHTFEMRLKDASWNANEREVSWSFTVLKEGGEDEGDLDNWLFMFILLIIIVIVVIVLALLFRRRPKRVEVKYFEPMSTFEVRS
jgi:hypothetical protein